MKVLDITEFFSPVGGGVRTYLEAKARWFSAHGAVEHVILVPGPEDRVTDWYGSRMYAVRGPAVPASPGYRFMIAGRKVREIIEQERPDVIELGSPFLAARHVRRAVRGMAPRPKLVAFYHCDAKKVYVDFGLRRLPAALRRIAGARFERYLQEVYGEMDLVLAASLGARESLERLGLQRAITVPLGVDLEIFRPERRDPRWKAEVGAVDGQPVLLYCGRLSADKGLEPVLAGLPELHRLTGAKLVLIGEGHLRRRLEALAKARPGMLAVLPFEPDRCRLARAYASADCYVAPFPMETFGLSAVEAMACGLPLIAVDRGSVAEFTRQAPWARQYRVGDSSDFVRAAREILSSDPNLLGRQAAAAARQSFSWRSTFEALYRTYLELVDGLYDAK
ncbi:GDP-mannose-dependent alpha-(1-6)-phosphatidylinositol dimannoside mannosyltransferase [bacterium HR33]|nr:GDP-mannose-dependent alpha-(1-6)-phosphatidylinositol dimannoside mannosyltransferase [bacterium HR33]